ncbi:hypothetical protein Misp02_68700 [Microtetraspora sp. NBRC 16547]|nr:hypothetical protein Misp02_68700 [Microtetraspora sp. NBRC 16547]
MHRGAAWELGVCDRIELTKYAIRAGWSSPEDAGSAHGNAGTAKDDNARGWSSPEDAGSAHGNAGTAKDDNARGDLIFSTLCIFGPTKNPTLRILAKP